jgi:thiosulfate dehydrogenase [quinone] large subunit
MAGLLGIGAAFLLGIFVNIAAASGVVMLVLMWAAELPLENNPFMDDHLVYAGVMVLLALMGAGRYLGLGAYWERLPIVKKATILR